MGWDMPDMVKFHGRRSFVLSKAITRFYWAALLICMTAMPSGAQTSEKAGKTCELRKSARLWVRIFDSPYIEFSRGNSVTASGTLKESRLGLLRREGFGVTKLHFGQIVIEYWVREDMEGTQDHVFFSATNAAAEGTVVLNRAHGGSALSLTYMSHEGEILIVALDYAASQRLEDILSDVACLLMKEQE